MAPCDYDSINTNYSKMLIDLSCSGRASEIYVVINVIERAQNSSNATVYYNTNVVFDRKGAILAKFVLQMSTVLLLLFRIFSDIVKLI